MTPFITTPYVSRVLGADGIGIYSYSYSIMNYFTLFAALGTSSYGAREISQHRESKEKTSKLFWEIELMTVFTTSICLFVWGIVVFYNKVYQYYFLALTPFLLATMTDISWYFTGFEKIKNTVVCNSFVKIAGIVLLFLFVKEKNDLIIYFIINSMILFLGNLSMWLFLRGMLVKISLNSLRFKKHFKETLIYFIPAAATSVYTVLDKTLIGVITGDNFQNGYYEQATKVINILKTLVFVSLNTVVGARISYLFAKEKYDEIHNRIEHSIDFILFLGIACSFGVIGIAENFVPLFFGKGYEAVVPLIYLLSPLLVIIGISNCLGSQYYTPSGKRKLSSKIIVLGAIVNLICNLILIPFWGARGAAIGSIVAELFITILYVQLSCGYMTWGIIWRDSWKRITVGAVMCAAVYYYGVLSPLSTFLTVLVQFFIGVAVYLGLMSLLKDPILFELFEIAGKTVKRISFIRRKSDG